MWSQRSPTQNHWTHEAGRQVHSSAGNFKLWFIVMQRFVRSIRSGNFPPYTQSLTKLVHWFFTYDHYHYVRWVSVHLRDMMTACVLHLQYIGKVHQEHVKSTEPNTEPLNPWGWQTGAQFSRKLQVMVHCHAAVCTIYPVWQLPALNPVIDEACTLVFHLWPLPLCTTGISSPPW